MCLIQFSMFFFNSDVLTPEKGGGKADPSVEGSEGSMGVPGGGGVSDTSKVTSYFSPFLALQDLWFMGLPPIPPSTEQCCRCVPSAGWGLDGNGRGALRRASVPGAHPHARTTSRVPWVPPRAFM